MTNTKKQIASSKKPGITVGKFSISKTRKQTPPRPLLMLVGLLVGAIGSYLLVISNADTANANFWVDTNGGSCVRQATSGAYSDSQACGSLDAAWQKANPGDTVVVKASATPYGDQQFRTRTSAMTSPGITFTVEPGVAFGDILLGQDSLFCGNGAPKQQVEWITIKAAEKASPMTADYLCFAGAQNVTIDGIKIDKNWAQAKAAFFAGGPVSHPQQNITIRNADFSNVTNEKIMESTCNNDTGYPCPAAKNLTLEDSKFHDMRRVDVVNSDGTTTPAADIHNECFLATAVPGLTLKRTHWYGCTVMNFNFGAWGDAAATAQTDFYFVNNIFESPTDKTPTDKTGYTWFQGCSMPNKMQKTGWVIEYNIMETGWYWQPECADQGAIIRNNVGSRGGRCPTGATLSGNIWQEGKCDTTNDIAPPTAGQPALLSSSNFKNITAHDWSYPAGAYQIDKGNTSSYPADDFTGLARYKGAAPDAGAYEYDGSNPSTPSDTAAPTSVQVTAPAAGNVSGTVSVTGSAQDNVGVTSMQFLLDDAPLGTAGSSSPHSISWDTAQASAGTHTLKLVARDAAGNTTTSSGVIVTVSSGSSPSGNLVAAYAFNEGTGTTAADSSGNGNNLTLTNTTWAAGKYGNGLSFKGPSSPSSAQVADNAKLDIGATGTVEAWFKPVALDIWQGVVAKGNDNQNQNYNYAIEINNSNIPVCTFGSGSAERLLPASTVVTMSTWYHLACVWDGANFRIYVNGVQEGVATQNLTPAGNASPLFIGEYGHTSGQSVLDPAQGVIDDVRIYNVARSAAQIASDRDTSVTPPVPDVTAPTTPGSFTATASTSNKVDLTWTASTDPGSPSTGVAGYLVYRYVTSAGAGTATVLATAAANATSYSDATTLPSTGYSYYLQAQDGATPTPNVSTATATRSVTTPAPPPDTTAPTNPSSATVVAAGPNQVNISWTKSTDSGAGVAGYNVYRNGSSTPVNQSLIPQPLSGNTVTYGDATVQPNTTYAYTIEAVDAAPTPNKSSKVATTPTNVTTLSASVGAAFEAESGTVSGTAAIIDDAAASAGKAVRFGGAGACPSSVPNTPDGPDPWGGCFPGPETTGVPNGTVLTNYTGPCTITADNTVIDGKTVNCYLDIRAKNVQIRNSLINGHVWIDDPAPDYSFSITDSTIDAGPVDAQHNDGNSALGKSHFTALRVETVRGIRGAWCEYDCKVQDSWLHGQDPDEGGHAHQSGIRQGSGCGASLAGCERDNNGNITYPQVLGQQQLIHNTIVCDAPDVPPDGGCSADITGYGDFAPIQNNYMYRNLLGATTGGTCAYGGSGGGAKPYDLAANNNRWIDNIFQRGPAYNGAARGRCGVYFAITGFGANEPGNVWQNNRWDTGELMPSDG